MEKIKTVNVVNTPNIEGNIGSCTVQSNEVKVNDRIFTADYKVMQVNSCTGEVITNTQYTSYFGVWISLVIGFIILMTILISASDNY